VLPILFLNGRCSDDTKMVDINKTQEENYLRKLKVFRGGLTFRFIPIYQTQLSQLVEIAKFL